MNPGNIFCILILGNLLKKHLEKVSGRLVAIGLLSLLTLMFPFCENIDRFYRPNLPEKLCSIGIIDADDTTKYISFEKSYQIEYPEEVNDSLRDFSFTISSSTKEILNYQSDQTKRSLLGFKIPDSIEFRSGEKYFLNANEKGTADISAEITVPYPPSDLNLISINKETITLSQFPECRRPFDDILKYAIINISFHCDNKYYYALLLEGTGINFSLPPNILGFLDFSVRENNVSGFFAVIHGLKMYHQICIDKRLLLNETPVYAYFIDSNNISGDVCDITLSVKFNDGYSLFDLFTSLRIKLLSIPEELYLFEKSLYSYSKVSKDPFSEPVYLNGNIKGGNGVFAICRSSELSIKLSPWY